MPRTKKKQPWGKNLTEFIGLKVTPELREQVERESRFARVSQSDFIRTCIQTRIDHLRSIREEVSKGHPLGGRTDPLSDSEMRRVRAGSQLAQGARLATGA